MGIKKSALSALRMALVWARKVGALKRSNHRWFQARSKTDHRSDRMYYGERQLSFDETPTFHLKRDFFKWNKEDCIRQDHDGVSCVGGDRDDDMVCEDEELVEQEIDSKAEEFIANFYSEMQLQRQISFLHYNEDA